MVHTIMCPGFKYDANPIQFCDDPFKPHGPHQIILYSEDPQSKIGVCEACGATKDYRHTCPPGTPRVTTLELVQRRIDHGCPKCGRAWTYEDLKNQMPQKGSMCLKCWEDPDEPKHKEDDAPEAELQYPSVQVDRTRNVFSGDLKNFIQTYMQEHFEELAETWWAKRLRDSQWQEEQDRLEEVFNNPVARVGKKFVETWPEPGYVKSSKSPIQRTWVWEMDELRHRHVWKEVFDDKED